MLAVPLPAYDLMLSLVAGSTEPQCPTSPRGFEPLEAPTVSSAGSQAAGSLAVGSLGAGSLAADSPGAGSLAAGSLVAGSMTAGSPAVSPEEPMGTNQLPQPCLLPFAASTTQHSGPPHHPAGGGARKMVMQHGVAEALLQARVLRWFSSISMPFYMVHTLVITYVLWGSEPQNGERLWAPAAALPVATLLASGLTRFVEKPAARLIETSMRQDGSSCCVRVCVCVRSCRCLLR